MELKDIQRELPEFKEKIDLVGVKNICAPIRIKDRANKVQNTVAKIEMSVCLPHHQRGTHMSRFTEQLHLSERTLSYKTLKKTLEDLQKILHADSSFIIVRFPYFIKKTAPVSKSKSLMNYDVEFTGRLKDGKFLFTLTVKVPVMTLCPCSKEISSNGAHNQRAFVTISIDTNSFVWIEDLVKLAENSASAPLYMTLKRPDEKFITELSYNNPRFVEDVVRKVADGLKGICMIRRFRVEVESQESIHNHSAYAFIEYEKE